MDIYEDDGARGILDLRKARRELAASATVNIEGVRRSIVAEISAAALLDIAYSLRPIGAEAADALNAQSMRSLDRGDVELDEPAPVREIGVGDLVVVRGDDAPGEILGLGYDQDSKYALVRFAESGDETRVWVDLLELVDKIRGDRVNHFYADALGDPETCEDPRHIHPDELDDLERRPDAAHVELPDGSTPPVVDGLHELTADDDDDDLERDFDTDTSGLAAIAEPAPEPAVSPLDALAEKAPAKKKGSKK